MALSYLMDSWGATSALEREHFWVKAAWMVFVGMLCDLLDGRVARMTGTASAFGAELDSLADIVTFGLTPALLSKSLISVYFPTIHPKWAMTLVAVYALGAAVRLARYNVESARTVHPGHVTRVFRGLPTPGAAGVIASLALVRTEYDLHWLDWGFLVGAPILGFLMVSRFPYSHVINRWLAGRQSLVLVVLFLMVLFVVALHPEALAATAATLFVGYALSGPILYFTSRVFGRPRWARTSATAARISRRASPGSPPRREPPSRRSVARTRIPRSAGRRRATTGMPSRRSAPRSRPATSSHGSTGSRIRRLASAQRGTRRARSISTCWRTGLRQGRANRRSRTLAPRSVVLS